MKYDVIVIGAGAAGMFCAVEAARRGRRVLIIDHAKAPGEKIRISGGGRCNFSNLEITPERFLSQNQHFAISPLARFTQWDFIARVDAAGIAWHEKTLGQLFCDGSSRQIIDLLVHDLKNAGAEMKLQTSAANIRRQGDGFALELDGQAATCSSLVIASGGKSIPKMGATSFGYRVAEQFGLPVVETRPALVPLTFGDKDLEGMRALSGVSVEASVVTKQAHFDEGMLFTHRGLSGPSILQISSYWREGDAILVDLCAGQNCAEILVAMRQSHGRQSIKNALATLVPERLAAQITLRSGLVGNLADQNNAKLDALHEAVHSWVLWPTGTEGYRTAEVTLGGVDTSALDNKTMEARQVPGSISSGKSWMSRDGLAATTSNGPGHRVGSRVRSARPASGPLWPVCQTP